MKCQEGIEAKGKKYQEAIEAEGNEVSRGNRNRRERSVKRQSKQEGNALSRGN
jgi:hypothetical protein